MAIQYFMRAYNTTLSKYVDWVVNDTPDSTGTYSGYPINQLINITVNRIVTSKVDNFLKQNQSLGGTDGYFFHVNSYDWKQAVAPILPPTNLVGFAVERGIAVVAPISTASNTSPIVVTTSTPHGLATGQIVTISGVTGNTNANGTWPVIVNTNFDFQLIGSTGNGTADANTGAAYVPNDMPTLAWDESQNLWRFFSNTNGDGTTIGPSQDVKVNNFYLDGYLALGPDPADTGAIRLSNNTFINWESNPSGTDIQGIGVDDFNRIKLGSLTTDMVYTPGVIVVDGYVQHDGLGNDTPSIGFIRDKNNTVIVAFRKFDLSGDIAALSSNVSNNVIVGDAVNSGIQYNTSNILSGGSGIHQFQVGSSDLVEIGSVGNPATSGPFVRFTAGVTAPFITQDVSASNGTTLTVRAQGGGVIGSVGGILQLASGIGNPGTGAGVHGTLDLLTGGTLQMRIFPDVANPTTDNNSIQYFQNLFRVDSAQLAPLFRQDDTASGGGQPYTIQAQNSIAASAAGGNLVLTSGAGTGVGGSNGRVLIQAGYGTSGTQIIVSPSVIAPGTTPIASPLGSVVITGNLEVVGTTTTVDSTVVDIIGRVIHANWSDPVVNPNVGRPTLDVGYSVHRGQGTPDLPAGQARDGAAWIWSEGLSTFGDDGYWRAVTIPGDGFGTDNFDYTNSPLTLSVLGKDFTSTSDPNPVGGYLPTTGGLRVASNITAVAARNTGVLTTIASGSNLVSLPAGTINVTSTSGFTSAGTLLIVSSAGPQTITYTGTSGGNQFTGCSGGTGTLAVGSEVAQTNASTTSTGSQTLPIGGSFNVASTTGFPTSGTLRVLTSGANPQGVQIVSYTSVSATSFDNCTGGTGTVAAGSTVSSPPIPGTANILLLGTDFGNRITHGDGYAPTNAGHIFSTSTGGVFDFWVNAVSQIQLGAADVEGDGFAEIVAISPPVVNPRIYQQVQPNTGTNNGYNLMVQAQNGQQQTGATTNNNGGNIIIASGVAGTGGSGAAGINGTVDTQTGGTLKIRVFPTTAISAADNNSIIYFENLFRVDTAQLTPRFRQDDTAGATGQSYTIQAQNAATNGGALVLTSGTGSAPANDGNVQIQTGAVDRVVVHPSFTEFRDTAEALRITPVSAGTTQITYASTDTAAQINQTSTGSATGANMTIHAQDALTTGGNLVLTSGAATTAGNVQLQTGVVDRVVVHPTFTEFRDTAEAYRITPVSSGTTTLQAASTVTAVTYFQADLTTNGGTGAATTLQAQNETGTTSTGGDLNLTSGTGTSTNGVVNLQSGGTTVLAISSTTLITIDGTTLQFAANVVSPTINQATTGSASGQTLTLQSQSAATTGGDLTLTTGTGGTVAGNLNLQTGAVSRVIVHPTFTEFRDTAEALRITPVSAGTTQITFAATDTAATINQTLTASTPSANMTIQSQETTAASGQGGNLVLIAGNATGTTATGGNAILTSGTGTTVAGNTQLQTGGVDRVVVHPAFTEFRDTAEAYRITPVSAGATTLQAASTATSVTYKQADLTSNGGTGATTTVQAQNETGTTSTGGDLDLTSGTGTSTHGAVNLQVGGVTTASVVTNKFVLNKGWRRNVTAISTTYQVLETDDYIAADTSTAYTVTMPASPTTGDTYTFKDITGGAGLNTLTISGNGNNIDGTASFVINQAYAAITLTYTGSQWSVT